MSRGKQLVSPVPRSQNIRFFFGVVALGLPLLAVAGSFFLNEQIVSGLGTAYAGGSAQAEDASTLFFNPAGIVLLETGRAAAWRTSSCTERNAHARAREDCLYSTD